MGLRAERQGTSGCLDLYESSRRKHKRVVFRLPRSQTVDVSGRIVPENFVKMNPITPILSTALLIVILTDVSVSAAGPGDTVFGANIQTKRNGVQYALMAYSAYYGVSYRVHTGQVPAGYRGEMHLHNVKYFIFPRGGSIEVIPESVINQYFHSFKRGAKRPGMLYADQDGPFDTYEYHVRPDHGISN
ncbi:hypothetical protein DdX_18562 [Ditylenchus destructor]|uniref:Uncharacterized protein n=1 Tax=Ditylenchus destructor TaxID=166010 RepID=A0AAD4MKH7_9BILA|nr:hypothetical protein DdX_18562 [Ditylenchus destructor]